MYRANTVSIDLKLYQSKWFDFQRGLSSVSNDVCLTACGGCRAVCVCVMCEHEHTRASRSPSGIVKMGAVDIFPFLLLFFFSFDSVMTTFAVGGDNEGMYVGYVSRWGLVT